MKHSNGNNMLMTAHDQLSVSLRQMNFETILILSAASCCT